METFDLNSASEQLHLYLDGELSQGAETSLFASLTQNDDLRNQFRDMMSIRNSVRNDAEAFNPPPSATNAVFSAVGFHSPIAESVALGTSATLLNILSKIWAPFVSAVAASVITALVFMSINNKQNDMLTNAPAKESLPPVIKSFANDNSIATNKSLISGKKSIKQVAYSKQDNNNIRPAIEEVTSNFEQKSDEEITPVKQVESSSLVFAENGNQILAYPVSKNKMIQTDENLYLIQRKSSTIKDISLHLRGITATSFPNINEKSQNQNVLSNFGLAAYTHLFNNFDIGLETGNETFGQEFYYSDEYNTYKELQNPMIFWLGLSLRYVWNEPVAYLGGAKPYGELIVGGTKIGPLGKVLLGLQYGFKNGIGATLGVEGTLLEYQNQKTWYNTKKLGLTYGLFYNF